ncbi:hypothetical protein GLE_3444 [Lysobacter enzymogenes]|uniref:Uncharacterized protein n=1 Tax=Lysobacter enzymogenes TaxID=69 RepID=A0A0S2DJH2_LYSEN|nr:hypothetical protein GLE_3444 [Lysobacter enzymogenes]
MEEPSLLWKSLRCCGRAFAVVGGPSGPTLSAPVAAPLAHRLHARDPSSGHRAAARPARVSPVTANGGAAVP